MAALLGQYQQEPSEGPKFHIKHILPARTIGLIKEAIEESRFPFVVDLVDEDNLAKSYRASVIPCLKQV